MVAATTSIYLQRLLSDRNLHLYRAIRGLHLGQGVDKRHVLQVRDRALPERSGGQGAQQRPEQQSASYDWMKMGNQHAQLHPSIKRRRLWQHNGLARLMKLDARHVRKSGRRPWLKNGSGKRR